MLIETIEAPDRSVREAISTALEAFNDAAVGREDPVRPFGVFLRDAAGAVSGGALAWSYWDWVFVDLLVLPETSRRRGLGTAVMRSVEREAVRRGCHGLWLDTLTFQAPGFYRKIGFTEFARLRDWAPGHDHLWLRKMPLVDWPDQGLAVEDVPDFAVCNGMEATLQAFNDAAVGPARRSVLAIVVRAEPEGPILGGLWGRIGRGWLFTELLFLPEAGRRRGLGTAVLAEAERVARARGCRGTWLDTWSFQARPFYERQGYTVLGEIPDYPAPHRRFLLAKRLDGAPLLADGAPAMARSDA